MGLQAPIPATALSDGQKSRHSIINSSMGNYGTEVVDGGQLSVAYVYL